MLCSMSLILAFAFPTFHYRPMRDADSVVLDLPAAPAAAAEFVFHYRPMLDADSVVLDQLVAPFVAAC
jgi:hypothetical protein